MTLAVDFMTVISGSPQSAERSLSYSSTNCLQDDQKLIELIRCRRHKGGNSAWNLSKVDPFLTF